MSANIVDSIPKTTMEYLVMEHLNNRYQRDICSLPHSLRFNIDQTQIHYLVPTHGTMVMDASYVTDPAKAASIKNSRFMYIPASSTSATVPEMVKLPTTREYLRGKSEEFGDDLYRTLMTELTKDLGIDLKTLVAKISKVVKPVKDSTPIHSYENTYTDFMGYSNKILMSHPKMCVALRELSDAIVDEDGGLMRIPSMSAKSAMKDTGLVISSIRNNSNRRIITSKVSVPFSDGLPFIPLTKEVLLMSTGNKPNPFNEVFHLYRVDGYTGLLAKVTNKNRLTASSMLTALVELYRAYMFISS